VTTLHRIEAGDVSALESYVRVGVTLSLRLALTFEGRRSSGLPEVQDRDFVHAAMGELEARHLTTFGLRVAIDEPYQHYQFAGRADVVAWDRERRAMLHIENRTQFPNLQQAAGSYNAKRAYLASVLAQRIGISAWRSVTHVMAVLWSSEAIHVVRLRRSTFVALCPDPMDSFAEWWAGHPALSGVTSTLVVIDPLSGMGRRRRFAGLDDVGRAEPRYRTYADAAAVLRRSR
jgi:hypothetical protein